MDDQLGTLELNVTLRRVGQHPDQFEGIVTYATDGAAFGALDFELSTNPFVACVFRKRGEHFFDYGGSQEGNDLMHLPPEQCNAALVAMFPLLRGIALMGPYPARDEGSDIREVKQVVVRDQTWLAGIRQALGTSPVLESAS